MKRIHVFAAMVLALALVTSVSAQDEGSKKLELTPYAGLAFPMGDWSDFVGMGFGGGGAIDYFIMPQGSIGGQLGFTSFSGKDFQGFEGESSTAMEISGRFRYFLAADVSDAFFLQGALGIHDGEADSEFGFGFGAGKRFPMGSSGNMALVPEAIYYAVSDANFFAVRVGLAFGL